MGNNKQWNSYTNEELINMLVEVIKREGDIPAKSFTKYGIPTIDTYAKILNTENKSKLKIFEMCGIDTSTFNKPKEKCCYDFSEHIITELPLTEGIGSLKGKMVVAWSNINNLATKIKYNGKIYDIVIKEYDKNTRKIAVEYDGNVIHIDTNTFLKGNYSILLGFRKHEHIYKVGDIVKKKTSDLEILDTIRKNGKKIYIYKCLNCGNVDKIAEYNLKNKEGCNVCGNSPKKVLEGYNDVNTTHPEIVKYFYNKEDAKKVSIASTSKISFICPKCGKIKIATMNNMYQTLKVGHFKCDYCSDNKSYGEKFVFNLLSQILDVETQKKFEWSDNKIYDFYIPSLNMIIETHGRQHYTDAWNPLSDTNKNDKYKRSLAMSNGIKSYIEIDTREIDFDLVKTNILNSELGRFVDLNKIDWLECHRWACNSLMIESSNLWNNGTHSTKQIGLTLGISRNAVEKYLKQANILGLCDYDAKEVMRKVYSNNKINNMLRDSYIIYCDETNDIYFGARDCKENLLKCLNVNIGIAKIRKMCETETIFKNVNLKYVKNMCDADLERFYITNKISEKTSELEKSKI